MCGEVCGGSGASSLFLPLPYFLHKLLPANLMPRDTSLLHQPLLHYDLSCNASVITTWVPEHHASLHTMPGRKREVKEEGGGGGGRGRGKGKGGKGRRKDKERNRGDAESIRCLCNNTSLCQY